MTIREKLEKYRDLFKLNLYAIITAVNSGLKDFDDYFADTPTDTSRLQLCVYLDIDKENDTTTSFDLIIQAQLPTISAPDSWDYQQAIKNYIKEIDPREIDETYLDTASGDNWPPVESDSAIIIYKISYQTEIDDCN